MRKTIKDILNEYKIVNPKLLTELDNLYTEVMRASREFGKRCKQLPSSQEELAWKEIFNVMIEMYDSDYSLFSKEKYNALRKKHGIYNK